MPGRDLGCQSHGQGESGHRIVVKRNCLLVPRHQGPETKVPHTASPESSDLMVKKVDHGRCGSGTAVQSGQHTLSLSSSLSLSVQGHMSCMKEAYSPLGSSPFSYPFPLPPGLCGHPTSNTFAFICFPKHKVFQQAW